MHKYLHAKQPFLQMYLYLYPWYSSTNVSLEISARDDRKFG